MTCSRQLFALIVSLGLLSAVHAGAGQSPDAAARRSGETASVPQFIQFSGTLKSFDGKPATGVVGITFLLFEEEEGGSSLWRETQNVALDAEGRYTVALGAATPYGLPSELFAAGQARWLAVEAQGLPAPARILLLSVPYAFKAGDAETLGGLPASAFLRAGAASRADSAATPAWSQPAAQSLSAASMSGAGTANYIPRWTPDGSTLGNSILFQSGAGSAAKLGVNTSAPAAMLDVNGGLIVRGGVQLLNRGTATATKGWYSQPLTFQAAAFSSSTQQVTAPKFQWQAEPTSNNTAAPGASLNLLYSANAAPAETGLKIAGNGQITFAAGQTFPGTGTLTGITAGNGLTGGGSTGKPTLNVDGTKVALLGAANTFTAPITFASGQTFPGTGTITGITAGTGLTGGGSSGAVTLNLNTAYSDGRYAQLGAANIFAAPITFASDQSFPGTVTAVNASTGLSGGGSGGVLTLGLNTRYTDGRYAQLGSNNTFSGVQVMNSLGIGLTPSYPLHVNGTIRGEGWLWLGGNSAVAVDAPGIIGGRLLVDGYGKVGIDNNNPQSALDVGGDIHASGALSGSSVNTSSLKIGADQAMTAAPRMYLTAYVPGPLALPGPVHAIWTIPSKNIVVTRMIVGGNNPCYQQDSMVLELYSFTSRSVLSSLTVSGTSFISDSGPLSIPIAAGTQFDVEIEVPNCGFGSVIAPSDLPISLEYMMQ